MERWKNLPKNAKWWYRWELSWNTSGSKIKAHCPRPQIIQQFLIIFPIIPIAPHNSAASCIPAPSLSNPAFYLMLQQQLILVIHQFPPLWCAFLLFLLLEILSPVYLTKDFPVPPHTATYTHPHQSTHNSVLSQWSFLGVFPSMQ